MPRVVVTRGAARGIARCLRFLWERDQAAMRRAAHAINERVAALATNPAIGRPVIGMPDHRELVVVFGRAGYLALYRHDPPTDVIYVLAFRHQREAGY